MRMSEVIRIDAKGRVTVPMPIREAVGVREGMYVMLLADPDRKEILVVPFADPEAKLVEFRVKILDIPGALARIAKVLADAKVDLLSSESRTLRRGELAEWFAIADVSKCTCDLKEIQRKIVKNGAAKSVEMQEISFSHRFR